MIRIKVLMMCGERLDEAYRKFSEQVIKAKTADDFPDYESFCARIDAIKAAAVEEYKRETL